jgi:hypothetical protein
MRKWLARLLDPQMAKEQKAFWRMWHNADEIRNWCGMTHPEAASAAQLLIDQDAWFWGKEPDTRDLPWRARCLTHLISDYRNWLDRQPFDTQAPAQNAATAGQGVEALARSYVAVMEDPAAGYEPMQAEYERLLSALSTPTPKEESK